MSHNVIKWSKKALLDSIEEKLDIMFRENQSKFKDLIFDSTIYLKRARIHITFENDYLRIEREDLDKSYWFHDDEAVS